MTKKHHPANRAERIRLKQIKDEKTKTHSGKVRKWLKESIKEQETSNELVEALGDPSIN